MKLTKGQIAHVEGFFKLELEVSKKDLGASHLDKHATDVGDQPAIKQKYHVWSPDVMDEIKKLMDRPTEQKIVEPSNSAWSPPVTHGLFIDIREINQVTKKETYPLSPMTNILDKLQNANYISTIDQN